MSRCKVCGRRLITGRKYCHIHRNIGKQHHDSLRFRLSRDEKQILITIAFFIGIVYFVAQALDWISTGIKLFFSQPKYAFITLLLLALSFYGYYKLYGWVYRTNFRTYNLINNFWFKIFYSLVLIILIISFPPNILSYVYIFYTLMILFFSFLFFCLFNFIREKFYS